MYAKLVKPVLDRCAAVVLLIILAVPLIIVGILIKVESKGPAVFRQKRYGKNRKSIWCYKFRTMTIADQDGVSTRSFKNSDAYITKVGKVLRKLSIDELPQVVNVLKGDMSIVGPRPVILAETSLIELREACNANSVKPGITGWAQVNGRDELDDIIKARMDGQYVANFGFTTDIKILLKTVWVIISAAGHQEGHHHSSNEYYGESRNQPNLSVDEG